MKLTKAQEEAVRTTEKNICVSAGAGTGKTRVLAERFLYLVENGLARPTEILAITFTEKAANEMKSRIAEAFRARGLEEARRELESGTIGTIHSFCSRMLKEHPLEAGVDPDFRVLEEDESHLLQDEVLDELMESRFQEPDVFQLLRVYSEEAVRDGLRELHKKLQTFQRTREDFSVLERKVTADPTDVLKQKSLKALEVIKKREEREKDISELERALQVPVKSWDDLERVREIANRFQRRGKSKEDIVTLRDCLDDWAASWAEALSEPFRRTFIRLVGEFESKFYEAKREKAFLDFNDLEQEAVRLISGDRPSQHAILNFYRDKFKFIMVDEFQDTSPVQNQLITLLSQENNLFIVGDWKQSIYGFRGAEVSIFFEKEKLFQNSDTSRWMAISESFRSRSEVLEFINPFFQKLWAGEGKTFDALSAGLEFPEKKMPSAEWITIEQEEGEKAEELRIKEAQALALRIQELMETGEFQYRDFAMLFRAGTNIHLYEYELRHLNIPYYVVSGRGFYRQSEIRDLMSALEFLENPHLDIPLAALLRSPLVQVSDETLFLLAEASKRTDQNLPLYKAVLEFESLSDLNGEERAKLRNFNDIFGTLLSEKEKWSASECLERILEKTGYHLYVLGLPQGRRRFANVRKLLEMARQAEVREPVHLGDFVRYIKGLVTQEVRESEAQVEAEEGNVVKLMTIHKAKGLEYKVVLLPDLNRKTKKDYFKFSLVPEIGFGMKAWNEAARAFEATPTFRAVTEEVNRKSREESKRLFYVAMTRAKEHLIFSGSEAVVIDGSAKPVSENENEEGNGEKATWYDWVSEFSKSYEGPLVRRTVTKLPHVFKRRAGALAERKKIRESLLAGEPIRVKTPAGVEHILEALKPIVPLRFERIDLPVSAYAVFEHDPEEYRRVYELGVLREEGEKIEEWNLGEDEESIHAADFGTVVHAIFEHLVSHPDRAGKQLPHLLESLAGDLNEQVQKEIQALCRQFLKSKTFSEIKNAKARYAEIPFVLRLKSGLIQGTLDLLYQTQDGKWVILDYKTSVIVSPKGAKQSKGLGTGSAISEIASASFGASPRNDKRGGTLEEVAERYRSQMMLYALAAHELAKIPLDYARLYFVRGDQTFDFPLGGMDFPELRKKFEEVQKQILTKR